MVVKEQTPPSLKRLGFLLHVRLVSLIFLWEKVREFGLSLIVLLYA